MQIGTGVTTHCVALVYPTHARRARGCVRQDSLTCAISNSWSWALTLVQANNVGARSLWMDRKIYAYNPLAVLWAVFHSIGLPRTDRSAHPKAQTNVHDTGLPVARPLKIRTRIDITIRLANRDTI